VTVAVALKQELIFDAIKSGEKPWRPITYIQKCPACNEEYYLD
jgi:hypothetical protein